MSWKKYGGTNKLETMNNLTVNSIVTDSLSLKKYYLGDWDICGGLRVKDNAIIYKNTDLCGNLIVGKDTSLLGEFSVAKDTNLYGNLVVLNDAYFAQNLYFDPSGNTLLHVINGGFGFNKYDPLATIDISSDRVQTVYMQTSTIENRNVYAQNGNSQGIVMGVDLSNAYINLFVDQSMNSFGTGAIDGQLRYSQGGNFYIDVSNVMNVRPRVAFGKDLTKPMNSDLDRVVIYDTEYAESYNNINDVYLKDIYLDVSFQTGTPLALISKDSSNSNVFMRMTTETGNGFMVGGGSFDGGLMGTLALTDGADKYPTMNIFSGDLDKYLKTSIGVNKHRVSKTSSGSNRYLLDVNGPTKMIHQELLMSTDVSMQIFAMEFYKENPLIGYAIGTPYNNILSPPTLTSFERYYLKTTDGGYTWTRSRVVFNEQTSFESGTSPLLAIHIFSENFALIAGSGGFSSYTINGGVSWAITDYNFTTDFNINTVFSNLNGSRTIFGLNNGQFIDTAAFANPNNVKIISSLNKYPSNLTNVLGVHGNDNFVYMVGAGGIQGYTLDPSGIIDPSAQFLTEFTFVDVSVFYGADSKYHSVAVGTDGFNCLIKYVHASSITTEWSTPVSVIPGSLNSVHVLNERHAIAVGDNGLVIYSDDAFVSWKTISHTELDSMGNGNVISELNLSNIYGINTGSPNKQNFAIVGDVQDFAIDIRQGRAKVFSFYAPYFFNRANNFVLEASGSILLSGDLRINDNGNVFTNSNSISLFPDVATEVNIGNTFLGGFTNVKHNLDVVGNAHVYQKLIVDSYSFLNDDVSLNGRLYVTKDASLNSNLFVGLDASFGSKLYLVGDASFNSRLFVGKDVSFGSKLYTVDDVSFNSRLFVGKDVSFGSKLYTVGDVSFNSRLFVGKDVSFGSKLYTVGDVSFNSRLYVGGDVSLNSNLYVVMDASLNSRMFVGGDVSLGADLYVVGDASLNSRMFVGGDVSLGSKLYVVDDVSLNSRLFVGQDVSLNANLYVVKDVSMNSRLFVGGDVSLNSNLYLVNDASLNSRLFVGGDVSFSANLYVNKDASMNSRLFVGKDVSLGSKLYLVGDASLNSRVFVGNDVSLGSKLYLVGDASLNSRVFVGGDVSLNANLYVVKDVSMNSRLFVGGDVSLNANLYVNKDVSMNSHLFVGKDVSFGSKLYVVDDVSMNSRLRVGGDVSFGSKLRVAGKSAFESDVSINANLFVIDVSARHMDLCGTRNSDGVGSGALIVQGGASIGNDLNVGGNLYINNYLDAVAGTDHIHIGYANTQKMYIGSSDFTNEIRIGTSISDTRASDVDIYIGSNSHSRVHILGNLLVPGQVIFENHTDLQILNKNILLNDQAAPGTSYGAGIYIREDGSDQAGQILVNPAMTGFFLKAPRSTNIVNFETNGMVLPPGLGRGILTIAPSTTLDGSNYTITRGVVDISDILFLDASLNNRVMRNPVTSLTQVNTQVIDGKLAMTGLYVNKLEATVIGNAQVDIAGNAVVSRMGLGASSVRPAYVLDISGNTFSNGTILQW